MHYDGTASSILEDVHTELVHVEKNVRDVCEHLGMHTRHLSKHYLDEILVHHDVHILQAVHEVDQYILREQLKLRRLKPGGPDHLLALLYKNQKVLELITPVGQKFSDIVVPDGSERPATDFPASVGGPIYALGKLRCDWCTVLCDDHRGPQFQQAQLTNKKWKTGTMFVAVPDFNARRKVHPLQPRAIA